MKMLLVLTAATALAGTAVAELEAALWPGLRGPNFNGLVEGDPPVEWGEDKNIRWKTPIPGAGHATPVVWGDRLFLQTAVQLEEEGLLNDAVYAFKVLAVGRDSGEILWEKTLHQGAPAEDNHHHTASFASTSGITDGERLYAFFGSQGIYCLDFEGNVVWGKDLGDQTTRNSFGEGSSPALSGEVLVVNWDHEGASFIVALDKRTGEERWRQERDEPTSWSTPLIVEVDGKEQVIVSASNRTSSYDLASGEIVWQCAGLGTNVIPTPLYRDGVVYVASGHRSPAMQAIRLDKAKGDISGTDAVLWSIRENTPYVSSPLLWGERLFMTKNRNAILTCYDPATGAPIFGPERLEGLGSIYASLVGAAGRVYISDLDGNTLVIKNASAFEPLATNVLDEGTGSSLVVVEDVIYLRGSKHLYAIAAD